MEVPAILTLVISAHAQALAGATPWWSDRTAGLLGGIIGSAVGLCGALIGILAGAGRGRWLVLTMMRILIVLGIGSLITGLIALAGGQPYAVYYPLLLCGVVLVFVMGPLYPVTRRRYQQIELRKMQAADMR